MLYVVCCMRFGTLRNLNFFGVKHCVQPYSGLGWAKVGVRFNLGSGLGLRWVNIFFAGICCGFGTLF